MRIREPVPMTLKAFENPKHIGNSRKYHTGKLCAFPGCEEPAGTAWSPFWCFKHNVDRIKRISKQFEDILNEKKLTS